MRKIAAAAALGLLPLRLAAAAPELPPSLAVKTAGLERHDGFLPYYWDARDGKLYLEVARLGQEFLYGSGIAGGAGLLEVPLDRGQLGDLGLCRFERVGPRVLLHREQTTHRSGTADGEQARVVRESFPSSVLASLPVVAEDGGRLLVDATEFLLRDTDVVPALREAKLGDWRQDGARSGFSLERSGAFPLNTEIEMLATFTADTPAAAAAAVLPDGHTMTLVLHHSFLKLPEPGFEARAYDPRVGFIPARHLDHGAPFGAPLERYAAARWRLAKKDPQAALSEPVQAIVYYLDRGIPEPERSAIREAALWWNHAFEEAGFKDAFVLRDLPEGASFVDARYSGIEWINRAERAWSIGQFQIDPRSGEILHGVARIDSHRRRTTARMWQNLELPRLACTAADAPDFSSLLAGGGAGPFDSEAGLVLARLRYLAAHEVGHTLGLQHNWAATTFGWGSVMDYLAPNVQLRDGALDLSDAYPTDIGSYDRLLVRWGYTTTGDRATLDAIVREAYARGIVFPLESDPRWAEYDWGPDPVAWLKTTQAVRRVILERFGSGQLAPGTPLYDLQSRFNLAYLYHRFGIQAAQQYVGGEFQTNALAGDGQTPTAWVPAAKQREALELLVTALAPENLEIPERIVRELVAEPNAMAATRERFSSEAGAAFSPLSAARILAGLIVQPLLTPEKAARLTLASGADALTLNGVVRRLLGATWDAPADGSPRLTALRRVSQRVVLDALMDLAASEPAAEARAAATTALVRLRGELKLRHSADAAAEAHLRQAERDVAEFLDQPAARKPRPQRLPAPPGRPIGE
jgi:hypothetical protein